MCRLLETIKISQGVLQNISLHNDRFNRSRRELFGVEDLISLENEIQLTGQLNNDIYKCRIIYGKKIEKIEILPYAIRNITSLKIVHDPNIQYLYKYENRETINRLFLQKENCDDILIVRNGLITDTSYCNLIFSDGNKLITPANPLLKGTKRAQLLNDGIISEVDLKLTDLHLFKSIFLINAMIDLDDNLEISMDKIF